MMLSIAWHQVPRPARTIRKQVGKPLIQRKTQAGITDRSNRGGPQAGQYYILHPAVDAGASEGNDILETCCRTKASMRKRQETSVHAALNL